MFEELKQKVCDANLQLVRAGLVIQTWGNASAFDRGSGVVVIKPSGVSYDAMRPEHMAVLKIETGQLLEGGLRPSSDTDTHLELYRAFPGIAGIVHTHSLYATAWAQAQREIPPLGTTHADYFLGPVPCTRPMTNVEIETHYELNTGKVIVERFADLDPLQVPAVLVASHAPFVWGDSVEKAIENALVLEYVARLASESFTLNPAAAAIERGLLHKHFLRKHGAAAYYGQK